MIELFSNIQYPTDICLLNRSREIPEKAIDCLYQTAQSKYSVKPRTYRNKARKEYLTAVPFKNVSEDVVFPAFGGENNILLSPPFHSGIAVGGIFTCEYGGPERDPEYILMLQNFDRSVSGYP